MYQPNLRRVSGRLLAVLLVVTAATAFARERLSLNEDWRFLKGDPEGLGDQLAYSKIKAWVLPSAAAFTTEPARAALQRPEGNLGGDADYAKADYDDSGWRKLNLPHDWGIEGPFNQNFPGETGKLPWWGVAWYRKHFNISTNDAGQRFILEIEGAMAYATVWLNGQFVGGWPYGYASWQLDLTPFVVIGSSNVLAIRLDNPPDSSRWYPGGGIYRNVWLTKTSPTHIGQWGVTVTTPEVSKEAATVMVQCDIEASTLAGEVKTTTTLFEIRADGRKQGAAVATLSQGGLQVTPGLVEHLTAKLKIPRPKLWSIEQPNLYVAVTALEQAGKVVDQVETAFGIRTIQFTPDQGLLLNGKRVAIQGVCNHHDLGALGAAFNVRAAERQLELLKDMGCNAIRTSHNPPAPELLDLCDRLGFVVMAEAFDCWLNRKKPNDYHLLFPDWHEADLRALVRHHRNHPSIILWSSGNEISEQRNLAGTERSKRLTAIIKSEDPTRPVTAGCNYDVAGFNGFQNSVDVFGYNYKPQLYGRFRATNANMAVFGSETASTISSRGEYFFPVTEDKARGLADFQVSSYDWSAPRWATTPDVEFAGQDRNAFVAGEFVWTGFDYLGEPTPYNSDLSNPNNYSKPEERARAAKELAEQGKIRTPSRSSYFGILDLAGFKKDRFYLYQSRWRPELRMAHILPHWTWPGREGEITPVQVYTSGDEAELFLNGKSLGRKKKALLEYRLRWNDVKYTPGELKVVAYRNGKRWATDSIATAGAAAMLALAADRSELRSDGQDLAFVTATVLDRSGQVVPQARQPLKFVIEGAGEIVATDNGDPTSFESFQSSERNAFNGRALAIVNSRQPGKIRLTASAAGLTPITITLRSK